MSPLKEWRLWRRLKGAFGVKRFIFVPVHNYMEVYPIEQYPTMEEALDAAAVGVTSIDTKRVFLEPSGQNTMSDIPQDDIILIIGNEHQDNCKHATFDETYRINTPQRTTFMGEQAAAIALAIRHGQ